MEFIFAGKLSIDAEIEISSSVKLSKIVIELSKSLMIFFTESPLKIATNLFIDLNDPLIIKI